MKGCSKTKLILWWHKIKDIFFWTFLRKKNLTFHSIIRLVQWTKKQYQESVLLILHELWIFSKDSTWFIKRQLETLPQPAVSKMYFFQNFRRVNLAWRHYVSTVEIKSLFSASQIHLVLLLCPPRSWRGGVLFEGRRENFYRHEIFSPLNCNYERY